MPDSGKPSPAWLKTGGNRAERSRRARRSEHKLAKLFGGSGLPRSGGAAWAPGFAATLRGDLSWPGFHVELKETEAKSLAVRREWLQKLRDGAARTAEDPALAIKFVSPGPRSDDIWVAVPLEVFGRLLRSSEESFAYPPATPTGDGGTSETTP